MLPDINIHPGLIDNMRSSCCLFNTSFLCLPCRRRWACPPGPRRPIGNMSASGFKQTTSPAAEGWAYTPKPGLLAPRQQPRRRWRPLEAGRYPHPWIKSTAASTGHAAHPSMGHRNCNAECPPVIGLCSLVPDIHCKHYRLGGGDI